MPTQHQQLLTTLENIAKAQAEKHFAHPIHCDKEGYKITYTDEERNIVSGNFIMIKTFPYCDSFSWQVVQDNERYFGEFHVNYDYEGEYVCCYNERCISDFFPVSDFFPDQQSLPIFADFRNALKPIEQLLGEELPCAVTHRKYIKDEYEEGEFEEDICEGLTDGDMDAFLNYAHKKADKEKWEKEYKSYSVGNCNFFAPFLVDTESEESLLEFYKQHGILFIGDPYKASCSDDIRFVSDSYKITFTENDLKKLKSFFKPRS